MREPTLPHHAFEDDGSAVAEEMRAIDQNDRRILSAGGDNLLGTLPNALSHGVRQWQRRSVGIEKDVFDARQAAPLRDGKDA
jgi:hypothetical protein